MAQKKAVGTISDKKLQEFIGWKPHWGQQQVLDAYQAGKQRIVIAAGVRWGKSSICAYIALKTFLEGISQIRRKKRDSVKIWIVAPSYELTQKVFAYIVKWYLKIDPDASNRITYRPFPQIKVAEGIWIQGKSATEPHSLLGEELDLIIFDEAAPTSPDIWQTYLSARLISRNGKVIFISTPFGQNWFWQEFQRAREENAAFNFTTLDNPTLENPERVKELERQLPTQVYKQNYEASFLPDAASIFPTVEQIIKDNTLSDVKKDHKYVMGVDVGKHEDYMAVCVIDTWNNNVVYAERSKEILYPIQKARITAVAKRYNNARIIVDSTGVGEPIADDLMREGLFVITDYKFSGKSKAKLVEKGIVFIEQKKVFIPPDEISGVPLVSELKAYGYTLTEKGNVTYGAPRGLHDDMATAFLLAVWGLAGKMPVLTPLQKQLQKARFNKPIDNCI
jgi:hypothetical protein